MSADSQRDMQQRALRNVRGLVDKLEAGDVDDKRRQRTLLVALFAGITLILVLLFVTFIHSRGPRGVPVDLPPPKPGQVMPQAPRASQ